MGGLEVVPDLADELGYCQIATQAGSRNPRHQQLHPARDWLENLSSQRSAGVNLTLAGKGQEC